MMGPRLKGTGQSVAGQELQIPPGGRDDKGRVVAYLGSCNWGVWQKRFARYLFRGSGALHDLAFYQSLTVLLNENARGGAALAIV